MIYRAFGPFKVAQKRNNGVVDPDQASLSPDEPDDIDHMFVKEGFPARQGVVEPSFENRMFHDPLNAGNIGFVIHKACRTRRLRNDAKGTFQVATPGDKNAAKYGRESRQTHRFLRGGKSIFKVIVDTRRRKAERGTRQHSNFR